MVSGNPTSPTSTRTSPKPSVDFYFDPVCPWAWITSRWIAEVEGAGECDVNWLPISLRYLNEPHYDKREMPQSLRQTHLFGHSLLRVAAAVGYEDANAEVGRFYSEIGKDIHVIRTPEDLTSQDSLSLWLSSRGFKPSYAQALNDASYDEEINGYSEDALERTGRDVGTPIITLRFQGAESSFFGPVMSTVPRGTEALRLWSTYLDLCSFPQLYEIKRAVRQAPQASS